MSILYPEDELDVAGVFPEVDIALEDTGVSDILVTVQQEVLRPQGTNIEHRQWYLERLEEIREETLKDYLEQRLLTLRTLSYQEAAAVITFDWKGNENLMPMSGFKYGVINHTFSVSLYSSKPPIDFQFTAITRSRSTGVFETLHEKVLPLAEFPFGVEKLSPEMISRFDAHQRIYWQVFRKLKSLDPTRMLPLDDV